VRDRDHLRALGEAAQRLGDRVRRLATDARVDLVEDHCRPTADRGNRERDPRQLSAGGRLRHWGERQTLVRADEEGHLVRARRAWLPGVQLCPELAFSEADSVELGLDCPGEGLGGGAPVLRKALRQLPSSLLGLG
jgi:hypothetical protein